MTFSATPCFIKYIIPNEYCSKIAEKQSAKKLIQLNTMILSDINQENTSKQKLKLLIRNKTIKQFSARKKVNSMRLIGKMSQNKKQTEFINEKQAKLLQFMKKVEGIQKNSLIRSIVHPNHNTIQYKSPGSTNYTKRKTQISTTPFKSLPLQDQQKDNKSIKVISSKYSQTERSILQTQENQRKVPREHLFTLPKRLKIEGKGAQKQQIIDHWKNGDEQILSIFKFLKKK